MSVPRPHFVLSLLTLVLFCASCAESTADNRGVQSRRQSSRHAADSQKKSPPTNFAGRVVAVEDGDTIVVLDDGSGTHKIRLQGIDAPEGGQAFGDRSRQTLSEIVFGQQVEIEWSKRDRYRRLVGKVLSNGDETFVCNKSTPAWYGTTSIIRTSKALAIVRYTRLRKMKRARQGWDCGVMRIPFLPGNSGVGINCGLDNLFGFDAIAHNLNAHSLRRSSSMASTQSFKVRSLVSGCPDPVSIPFHSGRSAH